MIRRLTTYMLLMICLIAETGKSSGMGKLSMSGSSFSWGVSPLDEFFLSPPDTLSKSRDSVLIPRNSLLRNPLSIRPDSPVNSRDSLRRVEDIPLIPAIPVDSVFNAGDSLIIMRDSIPIATDSLAVAKNDTIKKAEPPPVLDAPINYTATDSIVLSFGDTKKVYLYKNAVVTYMDIELKADYIVLDMSTKEIYAEGVPDSLGVDQGSPVFKQGADEYESRTIRYNFKTEKGIIQDIKTQQGEGYVQGERTKKIDKKVFIMKDGRYTTCDADHPHFYLNMTKAKVISNKTIITGPAYMVLEDFPIYFPLLPFGFFPNSPSYSSGIIMPSYGEENNRGFFLREGGYYWAASPFYDLKLTGDFYSQGSWAVYLNSNYKKRYKFSGSFSFAYNVNKYGEKDLPDYYESKGYSVRWSHSQDSKANPFQSFSASVNISSSSYDKENSNDYNNYLTTTKSSSISYSKTFENSPFSLSANMTHSQNSRDSTITLSMPVLTINMTKLYPLRKKNRSGPLKPWENIGFSYTGNITNSINSVKQDSLFKKSLIKDWKNGWRHSIPISLPSFTLLKYVNVTPGVNYSEKWHTFKMDKTYFFNEVTKESTIVTDTIWGFNRTYDYSFNIGSSTTIYGMFLVKNPDARLRAIRHKITPNLSFNYSPDFSQEKFGFWGSYTDWTGKVVYYDRFAGGVFGGAGGRGRTQSMSFSLGNNIEAKVLNTIRANSKKGSEADTTATKDAEEKYKKVKILDNLSFSGSYNFVADSMKLSVINISGRTTVKGTSLSFGATLDPYMYDSIGGKYNEFTWKHNNGLAKLGRITAANLSFSLSFRSKDGKGQGGEAGVSGQQGQDGATGPPGAPGSTPPDVPEAGPEYPEYTEFAMPWSLSTSFSLTYSRPNPFKSATINSSINVNGSLQLTDKWSMTSTTNFDIVAGKFSFTTFNVSRNLHCFNMSFNFVPFGNRRSYSFTLSASSSMLKDLKIDKQRSWYDN